MASLKKKEDLTPETLSPSPVILIQKSYPKIVTVVIPKISNRNEIRRLLAFQRRNDIKSSNLTHPLSSFFCC